MKSKLYTIAALLLVSAAFVYSKPNDIIAESNVKLFFTKDGCKVYAFKVMEGISYKTHFFTSCQGAVLDKDEYNITELENESQKN